MTDRKDAAVAMEEPLTMDPKDGKTTTMTVNSEYIKEKCII